MTNNLDALLAALYVKMDDEIGGTRRLGRPPRSTDSELVTLAVAQAMPGFTSESRWLRFVDSRLGALFPYVPKQPGWNKRLRAALPLVKKVIRVLAVDTGFWFDTTGLLMISDKGFASKEFEADPALRGAELLRPSFKREKKRKDESLLKSVRQLTESVDDTLKGRLDLERHGGRTSEGPAVRVAQRIFATAAAIWHNHKTGQPITRSLIAYDH
ncbi:IS982 family transposase [Streptomyces sp. H27-H1]|uniref:IS982 family transposase n=1 Tax=Streptomyces sp. H27-H1 TaxID=2996461 RepID=UPI0022720971|nr:IS982 family transposase [Streptomyces sp. H27-H1]MCY0929003.1 IS982 family transposase [Streptomyces sp. H27-H1]